MVEWFDSTILDLFQSIQSPVLTPLFKLFTLIGESSAAVTDLLSADRKCFPEKCGGTAEAMLAGSGY